MKRFSGEHCVLILAHQNPKHLRVLSSYMLEASADVYIHIDAKKDRGTFACESSKIYLLEDRKSISWGGFSMIEATLSLISAAKSRKAYDTYTLISGDSYALMPPDEFQKLLDKKKNIMNAAMIRESHPFFKRISSVYLPDTDIGALSRKSGYLERSLDAEALGKIGHAKKVLEEKEQFLADLKYFKGSQWWSLTGEAIDYILMFVEERPDFVEQFRYSAIPDEAFFQTIIMSSGAITITGTPLVHTKWDIVPAPHTFRSVSDIEFLKSATLPLARKFTDESSELIETVKTKIWDN